VADLHPEVLALIEAGPQQVAIGKDGIGVESYAMFARRVALRAVELDREDVDAILCALITKDELARMKDRLEAIRRRGKP
jgi:3-oxoacyl-[acyl-carrier-protein] synthase III